MRMQRMDMWAQGAKGTNWEIRTDIYMLPGKILEEGMATHSSIRAWRIPGTREPGGLPSMGLYRVRHD